MARIITYMNITFSLTSTLFLIGISQGILLSSVLLNLRVGNIKANRYLAGLTSIFVLILLSEFLENMNLALEFSWVLTLLWPIEMLLGVLIYCYVRQLTKPDLIVPWQKNILHFIPAILHILITWPLLLFSSEIQFLILHSDDGEGRPILLTILFHLVEPLFILIQITCYLILSLRLIKQHRKRIVQNFSNIERINLNWLYRLLFSLCVVYVLWIFELFSIDVFFSEAVMSTIVNISIVILIFLMAYLGFFQPHIYNQIPAISTEKNISKSDQVPNNAIESEPLYVTLDKKYQKSALSEEQCLSLFVELEQHMQTQQAYLNNELSLPILSRQIGISNNYLSQVINQQSGRSFFDYVNHYRIDEAKAKLADPKCKSMTIIDLAMSVGFNSKSSFYSAFKKHTLTTPSEYRKSLANQ